MSNDDTAWGHAISVVRLKQLLSELCDTDTLVPNHVRNLSIVRGGMDIGQIDLVEGDPRVEMWENEDR